MNNHPNRTSLLQGSQQQQQQQQLENKTKRKKCRGNRKKQRYRRQLYDQGLSSEEVEKLVEEKFPSDIQQQQQLQVHKEMTPTEQYNTQKIQVYIPLDRV
jgi:SOS response regulatory protein OraA/RecX